MDAEFEDDPVVSCDEPDDIIGAINLMMPSIEPELRRTFNLVKLTLFQQYGMAGLHERTNGRRVSEILEAEREAGERDPLESGEGEGISFKLYDSEP